MKGCRCRSMRRCASRAATSSRLLMHAASRAHDPHAVPVDAGAGQGRAPSRRAYPPTDVKKVGVLGAGMMGAGIAYVSALAGIEIVLIDTTTRRPPTRARPMREAARQATVSAAARPRTRRPKLLARITPTTDYALLKGVDLVIEAVFEDRAIKAEVTKKAEARHGRRRRLRLQHLDPADHRPGRGQRPAREFIGIHFFSPVDKMGLVEIILGKKTGAAALAKAIDYVLQDQEDADRRQRLPRLLHLALLRHLCRTKACEMLAEGIAPALIDNVGRMTGMPMGPLEVHDDVGARPALQDRASRRRKDLRRHNAPRRGAEIVLERWSRSWAASAARTARASTTIDAEAQDASGPAWRSLAARSRSAIDARAGRGAEEALALRPGGRSGALLRGRRHHRSARRRCRRDPGLGLRALDRRAALLHRHGRAPKPSSAQLRRLAPRSTASVSSPTSCCATWRQRARPSTAVSRRRRQRRKQNAAIRLYRGPAIDRHLVRARASADWHRQHDRERGSAVLNSLGAMDRVHPFPVRGLLVFCMASARPASLVLGIRDRAAHGRILDLHGRTVRCAHRIWRRTHRSLRILRPQPPQVHKVSSYCWLLSTRE